MRQKVSAICQNVKIIWSVQVKLQGGFMNCFQGEPRKAGDRRNSKKFPIHHCGQTMCLSLETTAAAAAGVYFFYWRFHFHCNNKSHTFLVTATNEIFFTFRDIYKATIFSFTIVFSAETWAFVSTNLQLEFSSSVISTLKHSDVSAKTCLKKVKIFPLLQSFTRCHYSAVHTCF